ncbi:MAG: hypothetical protein KKF42_07990, partial [Actinobacteria bacterium]|nr:hypothetical protein [Actinomycetota bacterium]
HHFARNHDDQADITDLPTTTAFNERVVESTTLVMSQDGIAGFDRGGRAANFDGKHRSYIAAFSGIQYWQEGD